MNLIIYYRDNGFLSYYEIKQIPNFLLAAPIIALSILGLKAFIQYDKLRFWTIGVRQKEPIEKDTFYNSRLSVYMYLWLFLLLFVTTTMHVQVIIRFFTSLPPLYWYVGHLWIEAFGQPGKGMNLASVVLGYFVLYGLVGIVLFSSFLPPA
jgi:phosphatidylinositol glycan class V